MPVFPCLELEVSLISHVLMLWMTMSVCSLASCCLVLWLPPLFPLVPSLLQDSLRLSVQHKDKFSLGEAQCLACWGRWRHIMHHCMPIHWVTLTVRNDKKGIEECWNHCHWKDMCQEYWKGVIISQGTYIRSWTRRVASVKGGELLPRHLIFHLGGIRENQTLSSI